MPDVEPKEKRGRSRPPKRFLRPGYITTAGSDELRERAERVLREHEAETEDAAQDG